MSITIPTEPDKTYHIYNRGVNKSNIFNKENIYFKFYDNIKKHLYPISKVYAWCLLPNHYHMLVHINTTKDLHKLEKFKDVHNGEVMIDKIQRQFSNMMNSYTRHHNKLNDRTGPLFDQQLQKKSVTSTDYFYYLITYIHNNPVHHGFCKRAEDYRWSSMYNYLNKSLHTEAMKEIIADYGGIDRFLQAHRNGPKETNPNIDF